MAIEGDVEMVIDDGDVIEVAARVKAVEQLVMRSRVPEPEVPHRGIESIPDEGAVGCSDPRLWVRELIICDL
jgi:hypothetical protein